MKKYFAYARVSTTRQGEQGVSLQQQRASIEQFAARNDIQISEWLEEQETAAKLGRPVFAGMLKRLRNGEVSGVVIHKIDRSARNLKDWAELGQLIDQGIEVHFSSEAVDLTSRGGRLSADIQAVVAADYIRNLREEVKKGFYGRLKQGITPLPAPLGYLDAGAGKAKIIDPIAGPIVREAFNLYSTGRFGYAALTDEVNRMGLRTRKGKRVSVNVVSRILTNPFYMGIIRLIRSGQSYKGIHEPLISPTMFERVQQIATGKAIRGPNVHEFAFSRLIQCENCGRSLVAERHKGHVYYRCHKRGCLPTSIREEKIVDELRSRLKDIHLTLEEVECIDTILAEKRTQEGVLCRAEVRAARVQLAAVTDRQNRLTDAYVDGALDKADYQQRKATLLLERCDLEHKLARAEAGQSEHLRDIEQKVELIKHASLLYENGFNAENRILLQDVTLNRTANGKTVMITVKETISEVAKRPPNTTGGSVRSRGRTFWKEWIDGISEVR